MNGYIQDLHPEVTIEEIEKRLGKKDSNFDRFVNAIKIYIEENRQRFQEAYEKDEDFKTYFQDFNSFYETLIIRKIYMTLGMKFHFDLNFWFGTKKERINIYDKKIDVNEMMNDYIEICRSSSILVMKILSKIDIESCVIKDVHSKRKYAPHVFLKIKPSDKRIPEYIIDLEEDISRIQSNSHTLHFGFDYQKYRSTDSGDVYYIFPSKILQKIDRLIDYPSHGMPYTDEYKKFLEYYSSMISNSSSDGVVLEWIKTAIENIEPYETPELTGKDRVLYHRQLLGKTFERVYSTDQSKYRCGKYEIYSVDGHSQKNQLIEYIVVTKTEPLLVYKYNEENNRFIEEEISTFISDYNNRFTTLTRLPGIKRAQFPDRRD